MTYRDLGYDSFMSRTIPTSVGYSSLDAKGLFPRASFSAASISTPLNATTDIVFSSTDNDTAAWTSGTLTFSNGQTSGTISAGSTGNIAATTYVYYDVETLGDLQTTTTASVATGLNKLLVAIVEAGAAGKDCKITPFAGAGLTVTNLTAASISSGSVFTEFLGVGAMNFVSTLTWTATDFDTATWASGSIKFANGTIYSIAGGNTGNIAAKTYIYLDTDTSITVLQTTTTYSTAIGDNKTLIAVVELGVSGAGCIISVVGAEGTTIDGDRIVTGKIQSADGNTYFDLENDILQISNATDTAIIDATGIVSNTDANFATGSVTDTTSRTTTSSSFTDVTSMSLNFTLARAARVFFVATLTGGNSSLSGNSTAVQVLLDSTQIGGLILLPGFEHAGGILYNTGSTQSIVSVASGSHTVKLRFKRIGGGTATISSNEKFLGYIVLGS